MKDHEEDPKADISVLRARKGRITAWVVWCSCGYKSVRHRTKDQAKDDAFAHGQGVHQQHARVKVPVA